MRGSDDAGTQRQSAIDELKARIESLPRDSWTLRRFGITPGKLGLRISNTGMPRILCVSLPKAGTHLLERALCLHPQIYRKLIPTIAPGMGKWLGMDQTLEKVRDGQVIVAHLPWDPSYPESLASRRVRGILMIRDPRDVILSQVHFISKRRHHPHHDSFRQRETLKEKLALAITGDDVLGIPSIGERLERYAGWLSTPCLVVRFEDLVGPMGGGDRSAQEQAVMDIYDHISVPTSDAFIMDVCNRLFSSDSPTFRRGVIGQWRERFDDETSSLFQSTVGDAMEPYGYRLY